MNIIQLEHSNISIEMIIASYKEGCYQHYQQNKYNFILKYCLCDDLLVKYAYADDPPAFVRLPYTSGTRYDEYDKPRMLP